MIIATTKEIEQIDKETINTYGLSGNILMERAGFAVTSRVMTLFGLDKKIIVLSGKGNNGGDGFVAARELKNKGADVKVYFAGRVDELSIDALFHYNLALSYKVDIMPFNNFFDDFKTFDLSNMIIIDALFGTGLSRDIQGNLSNAIRLINDSKAKVISIDIPSGICSDTGRIKGIAIKADVTITFGLAKIGHYIHPGRLYRGFLYIEDIGFPSVLLKVNDFKNHLIDRELALSFLPKRPVDSSKKDFGHVLLVAGSRGKTGAAMLSTKACLRSGCGLVTLSSASSVIETLQTTVLEEMTLSLSEDNEGRINYKAIEKILDFANKKASVIAIGPGLGLSDEIVALVRDLIISSKLPLVIDADGLNALSLSGLLNCGFNPSIPIVLTPHEGELCRLLSIESVDNRIDSAKELSRLSGATTILKGSSTLITHPDDRMFINVTGNSGMATAGSGDVLTGIVASFIAQGLSTIEASVLAVYLHGVAGDIASTKKGQHSLISSDIISFLPDAFKDLCQRD
ncbi:MAG TPA: NAD(P)H-hydrate dehydratase [Nitrospirae bacterium]|nr:NAD(P)H-hydrate dehydratase [Nitrospirota bacterium]